MALAIASPADAGLPMPHVAFRADRASYVPTTGMPVLVVHGPFSTRAALGIVADTLVITPLAPMIPTTRLRREDITEILVEDGPWYVLGRSVICIRRAKGPTVRLAAPVVTASDETETLCRLLRAWWRTNDL